MNFEGIDTYIAPIMFPMKAAPSVLFMLIFMPKLTGEGGMIVDVASEGPKTP